MTSVWGYSLSSLRQDHRIEKKKKKIGKCVYTTKCKCNLFFISNLIHCFFVYVQYLLSYFPLHVSGLTGPSSGGLNCTCSVWYSPPLQMSLSCFACFILHVLLYDKDICRGGEYHRLHVQFRPPDDGPVRPETRRGKKITVIVRKQKSSVSSWK